MTNRKLTLVKQPSCRRCAKPSAETGLYKGNFCYDCVRDVMQLDLFNKLSAPTINPTMPPKKTA